MTHVEATPSGGRLRLSRSRGAGAGVLLIVLGAFGALIPLVGGYVDFGFAPDDTWNVTEPRWWFEVLPGLAVVVGGLLLLVGTDRIVTSLGGWIAAVGGAWFVIGSTVQPVMDVDPLGDPIHTSDTAAMAERLVLTVGLGVVIVFVAGWAIGALAVVGIRDVRRAQERAVPREHEEAVAEARTVDVRRAEEQPATDADAAAHTAVND